eukprot:Nk52_evm30s343 gene=Nk52_evmTU30s343
MSASYLSTASVNVGAIRDFLRKDLLQCIDSVGGGKKSMVLDQKLVGPVGLISEYSLLKEHGVDKLYHLLPGKLETEPKTIIYFTRPDPALMKTMICDRALEEEGVYGNISIGEFQLDLVTLDYDLLSMEMETSFKDVFLEGDGTSLFHMAKAIMKLQMVFGIIPNIMGKGASAKHVASMLLRMRQELAAEEPAIPPEIDSLIILDRNVDLFSPLCTQLTYEGLIDEMFGIENSYVSLPSDSTSDDISQKMDGSSVKIQLNSGDKLYAEIRDFNFSHVGQYLNKKARQISSSYDERHKARTVGQIKEFVTKLGSIQAEHQSLKIHTNITERIVKKTREIDFEKKLEVEAMFLTGDGTDRINEYIEACIYKSEPLLKVLRLVCLQSVANGGLKPKVFEYYRKEILHTYGFEHIFTLNNIEKLGLLKKQEGKNMYSSIRKTFQLVVNNVNTHTPTDISYVYSGYAPLSVRIIQHLVKTGGWHGLEEPARYLTGPAFQEFQQLPKGLHKGGRFGRKEAEIGERRKVTLVCFIGGCTFAEVAAIRFLAQQDEGQRDFVIATTKLIRGDTLIESVMDNLSNSISPNAG